MAGIAAVGGSSSSELLQMLQALTRQQTQSTDNGITSATMQPGQPDESRRAAFDEAFGQALLESGLSADQLEEAQADVKATLAEAMSTSGGRPGEEARAAVDAMLEEKYGVDTQALNSKMEAMRPQGPPPGGGGPGGAGGYTAEGTSQESSNLSLLSQLLGSDSSTAAWLSSLFPLVDETA